MRPAIPTAAALVAANAALGLLGCGSSSSPSTRAGERTSVRRVLAPVATTSRAQPTAALDAARPVALAASGARVAWLRPTGGGFVALVVRDRPDGPTRVVAAGLPVGTTRLTIGDDTDGSPTAVLELHGTADPDVVHAARADARGELYAVPLRGSPTFRRPAVSAGRGAEHAPGLRDGVLTFARSVRRAGRDVDTVEVGDLHRRRSRTVWTAPPRTPVIATTPTATSAVAFTTHRTIPDTNLWTLRLTRPGGRAPTIQTLASGLSSNTGFAAMSLVDGGTRLAVAQWRNGGTGLLRTYDLPAGTKHQTFRDDDADLAVALDDGTVIDYADGDGLGRRTLGTDRRRLR